RVIEDDYPYLQDFAWILFAIVPLQANYEHNFSILKWFYDTYQSRLTLEQIENLQLSNEKLEIGSIVDLSDSIFGGQVLASSKYSLGYGTIVKSSKNLWDFAESQTTGFGQHR
ncbi:13739_t:CDS:2, partial [Cetraspora pellucida]